jgi:hypothetical protein
MNTATKQVSIRNYGDYSSNNYGAHSLEVTIGDLRLWFSYDTVIAFHVPGQSRMVRQNDWSSTTGKHLNWIDDGDKKARLPSEEFEKELNATLKKHHLVIS